MNLRLWKSGIVVVLGMTLCFSVRGDPVTWSVGASGCDFTTIAAAVADGSVQDGDSIVIQDAVHTEANITVNKSLTFRGLGMTKTIVQAAASRGVATDPLFFLHNAAGKAVTFRDLTMRYGNNQNGLIGSAVVCDWTDLYYTNTYLNCLFTMNDSPLGYGGGAVGNDGFSALIVSNCVFEDNAATWANGGGGGGIYARKGDVLICNSTFHGNTSHGRGAGLYLDVASYPWLFNVGRVLNCTFTGNSTGGNDWGGAIFINSHPGSTCLVANCTIVSNLALVGGGIGIDGTGQPEINSTILASNAATYAGADLFLYYNTSALLTNSLYTTYADWGGALVSGNNLTGQDPSLDPLADNGGPTPTMALRAGSPCMDAGANPAGLATDQRGGAYARVVGLAADIGAFEYGAGRPNGTLFLIK